MDLSKIKLIIWDLDETFWNGTLSEGDVDIISSNIELIKQLTDRGIINSICSKNDENQVKEILSKYGIWEYFVFNRISWQPKGENIHDIIQEMNLRSCNVAFIDDNSSNLNEAKFYSPDLQVFLPEIIPEIRRQCLELEYDDSQNKRLNQYKVLEKKQNAKRKTSSNLEFLQKSQIKVEICYNCFDHFDRIHEMIMRTNQLNYTKNRLNTDELKELLSNEYVKCGYVTVKDCYGDYGISGFYSLEGNTLTNFLFSCRTMGMGVEQYVYSKLNFPNLKIKGDVAYQLNDTDVPYWINKDSKNEKTYKQNDAIQLESFHALIKGPCDMEQILGYINNEEVLEPEFTYINPVTGVSIESYNHTYQILEAHELSDDEKKRIIDELPFSSPEFFSDKFYSSENSIVFFSLFTDPNLGLYKRRDTGEIIAFGEYCYDLTDQKNWKGYCEGSIFNANCEFTEEILKDFSNKYKYIGRIDPIDIVNNLKKIRSYMPEETLLVLFLGVEFPYPNNTQKSCEDRHNFNKKLNPLLRKWSEDEPNVEILEFGSLVKTPKEMLNNINHFIKPVYFQMAQNVLDIINRYNNGKKLKRKSWFYMQKTYFTQANKLFGIYLKVRKKIISIIKK